MAARPNRRSKRDLPNWEEIAQLRAYEEALEVREKRRLVGEQVKLAKQQRRLNGVELGEQRLAQIARLAVFVTWLAASVLALVKGLEAYSVLLICAGTLSVSAGTGFVVARRHRAKRH